MRILTNPSLIYRNKFYARNNHSAPPRLPSSLYDAALHRAHTRLPESNQNSPLNMDSMRSLNKSLPSARSNRPTPPEELLPAFRQAALSVTNLYKSAASYHDSIRQAGYQDAIDDLLKFLDKENLGLQDGEGWRIRQWATARYDISHLQQSEGEDEDGSEHDQTQREQSPEKPTEDESNDASSSATSSQTPITETVQRTEPPVFQFSHGTDGAMQTDHSNASTGDSFVRIKVPNQSNRTARQHGRHTNQPNSRLVAQTVGSKRKMPFPDISEIFNFGLDKKDEFDGSDGGSTGGGSKRTRFV